MDEPSGFVFAVRLRFLADMTVTRHSDGFPAIQRVAPYVRGDTAFDRACGAAKTILRRMAEL